MLQLVWLGPGQFTHDDFRDCASGSSFDKNDECKMIVSCIANTSRQSPTLFQSLGYTGQAVFQVSPGTDYVVHAMALLGLHLVLLLCDDTGQPNWYPASQFKVGNSHLPPDWGYDIYRRDARGLRAIWGYRTMIDDKKHNDALICRNAEALKVFAEVAAAMPLAVAAAL